MLLVLHAPALLIGGGPRLSGVASVIAPNVCVLSHGCHLLLLLGEPAARASGLCVLSVLLRRSLAHLASLFCPQLQNDSLPPQIGNLRRIVRTSLRGFNGVRALSRAIGAVLSTGSIWVLRVSRPVLVRVNSDLFPEPMGLESGGWPPASVTVGTLECRHGWLLPSL